MVRFNDKTAITTVASNDILPITDMSESSDDKKITVNQLSKFTVDNIGTLTGGLGFSKNNLTDTLKANYDTAYDNLSTLGLLNQAGLDKLALSNMFPIGYNKLDDKNGYEQIWNMAHSTYDKSKVTIVGSPTITDNGIASGFSGSNYLISTSTIDLSSVNSWEIICGFNLSEITSNNRFLVGYNVSSNYQGMCFGVVNGVLVAYLGSTGTSWNIYNGLRGSTTLSTNTNYIAKLEFNGTQYIISLSTDNGVSWNIENTFNSTTHIFNPNKEILIGLNYLNSGAYFIGSIDIKKLSIIVDDVEIFNTNQESSDTIGSLIIPYKKSFDGSKIVDISNVALIDEVYNLLGYSEYYVIDQANEKFYLPKLDNPLTDIVKSKINYLKLNCYREPFITAGRTHTTFYIKGDTYLKFKMHGYNRVFYNEHDVEYSAISKLDTGTALQNGKQYYIYLVETGIVNQFDIRVSLNASYPSGFNANNSYCIGGFHTLCVAVTSSNAPALPAGSLWDSHPAIGYSAGDIIPNSIWCETHRPMCNPAGMVYIDLLDLWVDIYLQSGTGTSTRSAYGATITNSRTPIQHLWDMQLVGKRLAQDAEFMIFAEGSNQKTAVQGAAQPNPFTAGGHLDTAGKRMISGYFVEECCGLIWQWLDEVSPHGGSGWVAYGDENTRGASYGMPYILEAGGSWGSSSNCGSRSRASNATRSYVDAYRGARGVSLPKFVR